MNFTEPQSLAIIHASRPLQPQDRAKFLDELQGRLIDRSEIGDGELHRVLRELQRKYLRPPEQTAWS